jgi:hypothetical protein
VVHSGEGAMTRPLGPVKVSSSLAFPEVVHLQFTFSSHLSAGPHRQVPFRMTITWGGWAYRLR